ncbi:hypothetical protein [uncultured Nitratireductor sp.]|uniref:hypothetical protein n=1 Tax=uncultured Nitratireductor sp. TaxID=520953 RepID=UPI0025FEB07F|nr:hypothetical protein [uncultured Nitratireductor sp.]
MTHTFLHDANETQTIWRFLLRWTAAGRSSGRKSRAKRIDPRDIPENLHQDIGLADTRSLRPKRYVD